MGGVALVGTVALGTDVFVGVGLIATLDLDIGVVVLIATVVLVVGLDFLEVPRHWDVHSLFR